LSTNFEKIAEAVGNGEAEATVELITQALNARTPAMELLDRGLVAGVRALGKKFQDGEAFLPEILISVRAMNAGLEKLQPLLNRASLEKKGVVVLGTIKGDLHDIGKNLVAMMLKSNSYEVMDLGVDVPPEEFVRAARDSRADLVGISGLLTTTVAGFPTVIDSLREAGLRPKVKVMVGGAPVTPAFAAKVGADGFAEDCVAAVEEAARLIGPKGGAYR